MNKILEKLKTFFTRNNILIAIAVIAIIVTVVLIFIKTAPLKNLNFSFSSIFGMSNEQIADEVIKYINDNHLSEVPASLVSVSGVSGLVKVKIKIGTQEFDSYATKDGKLFFPQAFEMNPEKNSSAAPVTKTDRPLLEAFIVARCPYGLQMQRMIADAIKNIPSLEQHIKIKYIGSISSDGKSITAMHGDAEAKENLRQICIREEQPDKYWAYVSCQMKAAGTEKSCEQSTNVDSAKLNSCISDANKGVAYAKKDFDSADGYGASGSPTLILNGTLIEEFTSGNKPVFGSARSSDEIREIICQGSNKQADFCSQKLNTNRAASSFSQTYEGGGSGNNNASCE